jgi:hypothetical protein
VRVAAARHNLTYVRASVDRAKPAICRQFRTGHFL